MQEIYERHKKRADFYFIYIREAHPTDGRRPAQHVQIAQPKSFDKRREIATECSAGLDLTLPVLVDDMKDTVARAYSAMPDRLFILDAAGKIAYRGERGPRGFKVDEMERALVRLHEAQGAR